MTIKGVRRAESVDVPDIEALLNHFTELYFGEVNVSRLIEHSFLPICLYDEKNKIVAFISFNTTPNVPAIPPWDWLPWIINLYSLNNLTTRNTLFIHLMAWESDYVSEFLPEFLSTIFYSYLHIQFIILVAPPGVPDAFYIDENFSKVLPVDYIPRCKVQTIFITLRQRFVTRYKIRKAVEEDNDDIVPLIDDHASSLKDLYGEFYVAEIIQSLQDPEIQRDRERQFIVAESNGIAVGVLCLTSVLNYNVLNQCFELKPFNGLKKANFMDLNTDGSSPIFEDFHFDSNVDTQANFDVKYSKSITLQVFEDNQHLKTSSSDLPEELDSADSFTIIDSLPSYHTDWFFEPEPLISDVTKSDAKHIFSYILLSSDSNKTLTDSNPMEDTSLPCLPHVAPNSISNETSLPRYFGEGNAFAIELFATNSENERAITPNLIEASFECYPDREYCILTVPSNYPPCPLLQPFTKVPSRPYAAYPQELYVLHRSSLFGNLDVREAKLDDLLAINNLVNTIRKEEEIFMNITKSILMPTNSQKSYILTVDSSVVGCIVVREEDEFDYIAAHYIVHDYLRMEHYPIGSFGLIIHAVISPIFQTHKRYFLSEVHRLSNLAELHYCLYPTFSSNKILGNIIDEMIPVEPRLCPEYNSNLEKDGDVPSEFILRESPPYSLYIMNLRHCSVPKMDVNFKIVVVGASLTGVSFLEHLVFGQTSTYINFTNITLVSIHGFNYVKPPNKSRDLLFPFEGRYNYQHMLQICLHTFVNLVTGVMTTINRKEKQIVIDKETIIPYDFLFLTCGEQYYPPALPNIDNSIKYPENLFVINTEIDGHNALTLLKEFVEKENKYTVIVYGASLEAYCCLSALRSVGIPGEFIEFVEPFPNTKDIDNDVSLFNDGEVDDAVAEAIEKEGIKVHTTYFYKSWEYNEHTNRIQSVTFESKFRLLTIPCIAVFFYYKKTVNQANITAITRAGGLVYDGRLLIDTKFQTNDPFIFAAGSLTKYSRKYYADHLSQKYFNHFEVGELFALNAKKKMDPTYVKEKNSSSESDFQKSLTPIFTEPIVAYCTLPGKLNYLYITKPGKPISIEAQMNKEDYGRVLITGNVKDTNIGYFRLHLNHNNFVETITCLTKQQIDVKNMVKLWGKHEILLNKLVQRFEMFLIQDLFEYFRQPWAYAIFHERFEVEIEKVNTYILNGVQTGYDAQIISKIVDLLERNEWQSLTPDQRAEVVELYEKSNHKKKIEENLLQFLLAYDMHLPVYAHPLKAKLIIQGFENSPLHFPQ